MTMADGSDDPEQIDELCKLVERGVVIAAASRYMSAGRQIGGPLLKQFLSRVAGLSLYWFGRVGTRAALINPTPWPSGRHASAKRAHGGSNPPGVFPSLHNCERKRR